ncbi:MAG: hypothetical protein SNJ09_01035 [Rikenellaceae bacterium]
MRNKVIQLLTLLIVSVTAVMAEGDELTREQINALREERGLVSLDNEFVPKGCIMFGAGVSYSAHDNDDYKVLLIEGVESYGYTVKATPMVAYAVATNMALGVRGVYSRSLTKMDSASMSFGDEEDSSINLSINNYYALTQSYSAMGIWRQYIPLGRNKRFALFNEMQLEVGGSTTKMSFDEPTKGTYSRGRNISLGVCPGIVAFATNDVAFEISVGMLGLSYSKSEQVHNQVEQGETSTTFFNFKINLLSIGLGVAFYL